MRKHILKKSILLILILLQFSCNLEEEFITEKNHLGNNRIRYLYGEEALKKSKNLESKIMTSHRIDVLSRTNIALNTNEGIVDYTKVLEVVDENNNVNYTFKITNHPEDSETVFHNLVLSNENTSDEKVLLLKYESDTPTNSIVNFNGTVTRKSITSATNPCDTSTSDIDFTGNTGSDNGSAIPIPGDNNIIATPPNLGGTSGSNSGNSLSDTSDIEFMCNSCNFSSNTWSGFSIHKDAQGQMYPFTIIYTHNKTSNTNTNINPCDPNGNIGIINDSVVKTPCEELKNISDSDNTNFKLKINELKQHSVAPNSDKEYGFELKRVNSADGSKKYVANDVKYIGINGGSLIIGDNILGGAHCHTDKGHSMHSFTDIKNLLDTYDYATPLRKPLVVTFLVAKDKVSGIINTYALKINDEESFRSQVNEALDKPDIASLPYDEKLKALNAVLGFKYDDKPTDLEKVFLEEYKLFGISLYKSDNLELNNWKKLELKTDGTVDQVPCNN
jgi:hypothetical protein